MKIKSLIAATAIAVSSFGALAATSSLGIAAVGTPLSFSGGVGGSNTAFEDIFTFIIPANNGAGLSLLSGNLSIPAFGTFSVTFTGAALYSNFDGILNNGDDTPLFSYIGTPTSLSLLTPALTAEDYYIKVTGTSTGTAGGMYSGAVSVSAVPEPETFAMLLAGLGMMGSIAMRRNKKTNS